MQEQNTCVLQGPPLQKGFLSVIVARPNIMVAAQSMPVEGPKVEN